jgi:hypothetical protein
MPILDFSSVFPERGKLGLILAQAIEIVLVAWERGNFSQALRELRSTPQGLGLLGESQSPCLAQLACLGLLNGPSPTGFITI